MGKGGARLVTTRRRAFSDLMGTDAGGAMADGQQPLNTGSPGPSDEGHNPLGQDTPRSSVGSAIGTAKTICIERANAIIYLICAFSFAPASICFTPIWEEYEVPGVWVFLFGARAPASQPTPAPGPLRPEPAALIHGQGQSGSCGWRSATRERPGSCTSKTATRWRSASVLTWLPLPLPRHVPPCRRPRPVSQLTRNHRHRRRRHRCRFINCLMYAFGSFTFIVGSVLFLPIFPHSWTFGALRCGAILFTVGSVVFTFAAFLNVTEVRRNTEVDAEQMKLVRHAGTVVAECGAVVYQLSVVGPTAQVITVLYGFGGVIFVIGSVSPSRAPCPAVVWSSLTCCAPV